MSSDLLMRTVLERRATEKLPSDLRLPGIHRLPRKTVAACSCPQNIETWLYWLTAQRKAETIEVDETTDYNRAGPSTGAARLGNEDSRLSGECLHALNHNALPNGCPPMLGQALPQLRSFVNAVRR